MRTALTVSADIRQLLLCLLAGLLCFSALPAASQTIDRFILIQPISVCDNAGANCAAITNFPAETRAIYAQAGVFPVFLTPQQVNNSALLTVTGVAAIDGDGSAGGNTIQAWFTQTVDDGSPGTLFGEAWIDGNGVVINSGDVAAFNGGVGRRDTFAHELGHNLGLDHNDFGAGGADNLMTAGATRNIPSGVNDIFPTGTMDQLTAAQIAEIRDDFVQAAVDCNGTPAADVIARGNGQVCNNMAGLGDNDTLSLTNGALVMGNMTGNEGNDNLSVTLGSFVLGNVDGGAGNDTILIADASEVGQNGASDVLGGIGDDQITINSNSVIYGGVYGDDNDGNEANGDGIDIIQMLGGSVGGDVNGEGGDDNILISGGNVAGNVLGGGGADTIETQEPATIEGNIDGGAGNDIITVASDPVDILGGIGDDALNINLGTVADNVYGDDNDGNEGNGDGVDTITMTGGMIANNIDGEGAGDTINISAGSVGGNVLGGGGGDGITTSGSATITGNIDGEDGDDTLSVATSAANVLGGHGGDGITINAGTVAQNVFGDNNDGNEANGDGIDIIRVNGGSVTGNVNGEGANDEITIAGGSIGGNVLGGTGEDEVDLASGTVALNVDTGADADQVRLHGTAVTGDITTLAGNDTVDVESGSVRSVLTGDGDDDVDWTGGTVTTSVTMGANTDALDIFGVNAGGAALQAGLTLLDGGDDASSADGQVDTLTLHGVDETLTRLDNWEFINLVDNSEADLGAVSRTITTQEFTIEAGSVLIDGAGVGGAQVYTIAGILDNRGIVAMGDPAALYDEIAVTQDYQAVTGALLTLDSFLGAAGSPSDFLRVGGATTGDPTGLVIFDTNPGAGAFNPIGIELVRVEGPAGGTAQEDFFLVAGPIEKGLWTYDLDLDDTRANPGRANADVHVLYSRPDEITQFAPYFATAALTLFQSSLEPWIDRQYTLADTLATNSHVTPTADIGEPVPAKGTFVDLWLAPFGAYRKEDSKAELTFFGDTFTARMDYDQTSWGFLGGVDVITITNDEAAVMAGVYGGYLNSSVSPDEVAVSGDYEGGTVGIYGSYLWQGLTLSAVAKVDVLEFDWEVSSLDLEEEADVDTWGGRIEAAYKIPLGDTPWLEPYGNLTYAKSSWDKFSALDTVFDLDGNESLLGRLGLRLGADFYGTTQFAKIYAGVGVAHEFEDATTADVASGGFILPLTHEIDATAVEVQGGLKFGQVGEGLSLTLSSSGRFSEDIEDYGGKATLNYQF